MARTNNEGRGEFCKSYFRFLQLSRVVAGHFLVFHLADLKFARSFNKRQEYLWIY